MPVLSPGLKRNGWRISADGIDDAARAKKIASERRKAGQQAKVVRHSSRTLGGTQYMTHAVIVKGGSDA